MLIQKYDDWKLDEGVPGTPFGIQVGDYFEVTGEMLLANRAMSRDDNVGNRWRAINVSPNGKRTFSNSNSSTSLNTQLLKDIGEGPAFLVKATRVHPTYVEGLIKFSNGLMNQNYQLRVLAPFVKLPEDTLIDLFLRHDRDMAIARGKCRFIVGNEDFLYTDQGSKKKDVVPGIYLYYICDFELSQRFGEPMLYCAPSAEEVEETKEKNFLIPITKFMKLTEDPSPAEAEVICEWFGKVIGAEVTYDRTDLFRIPWFSVNSSQVKGHPSTFSASPFLTRDKAQQLINDIHARAESGEKFPFDVSKLQFYSGGSYTFTFVKLMDYANLLDIGTNVAELFRQKRGKINTQKFGV